MGKFQEFPDYRREQNRCIVVDVNSPPYTSTPSVLLVEGSSEVRQRMRSLIEEFGVAKVLGEADNFDDAIRLLQTRVPEVVILEPNLEDGRGFSLLIEIRRQYPESVLIVLTNHTSPELRKFCDTMGVSYMFNLAQEFERVPEVLAKLRPNRDDQEMEALGYAVGK